MTTTAHPNTCNHPRAQPVNTTTGQVVAYLCPTCDKQLPDSYGEVLEARRELLQRQEACLHETEVTEVTTWAGRTIVSWCGECGTRFV